MAEHGFNPSRQPAGLGFSPLCSIAFRPEFNRINRCDLETQRGAIILNWKDVGKNLGMLEAFSLDHERRVGL